MLKFVGTRRDFKDQLRQAADAFGYTWAERAQVRYAAAAELVDEAKYGVYDIVMSEDGQDYTMKFLRPGRQANDIGLWLYGWLELISALISVWFVWIPCWALGHDWQDESWAGPDSGGMGMSCRRCHASHYTTLY